MPIHRTGPNVSLITKSGVTSQSTVFGLTDTQTVHIAIKTDSTLIAYNAIDISNTSAWKHTNTTTAILEYILIQVDPSTNFLGEIKLGFLSSVDATNGDFNQFLSIKMARKSDLLVEIIHFGSHGLHCLTASHFGPIISNSTLFQTDVNLGGPDDPTTLTYPSGNGDIVLIVDGDGTNFVDVALTLGYETI
jgi:hypothetical protein